MPPRRSDGPTGRPSRAHHRRRSSPVPVAGQVPGPAAPRTRRRAIHPARSSRRQSRILGGGVGRGGSGGRNGRSPRIAWKAIGRPDVGRNRRDDRGDGDRFRADRFRKVEQLPLAGDVADQAVRMVGCRRGGGGVVVLGRAARRGPIMRAIDQRMQATPTGRGQPVRGEQQRRDDSLECGRHGSPKSSAFEMPGEGREPGPTYWFVTDILREPPSRVNGCST